MEYTIKHMAQLAGTTSRTLRHYDHLGLLTPSRISSNGYRYYNDDSALRLQQILLLKHLGMPLEDIRQALETSPLELLIQLRTSLENERTIINQRITSVTQTIDAHSKGKTMSAKDSLQGFNDNYKDEVIARWGQDAFNESNQWWKNMSADRQHQFTADVESLNLEWVGAVESGIEPSSAAAQEIARKHVAWLASIPGTPAHNGTQEATRRYVVGLAHMYPADPRFAANYGGVDGAMFVRDALMHLVRE